jgi:hypothetical protein
MGCITYCGAKNAKERRAAGSDPIHRVGRDRMNAVTTNNVLSGAPCSAGDYL